ncbi:MAG: D-glycero-beta-D-manno-heptose 1-phosphate adenylyltransferase [Bacteroidota bacterium]
MRDTTTDLNHLLEKLNQHRRQGKTTVFTNGCFDILHRGHVTYLQAARDLGDLLVIGVNTDASVKRLKGESRPINNEDDRVFILQSLACVDYVIKFGEDTPYELLSQIKPDILVKGGDYKLEEVVGREFAQQVALIDFVDGYSTTKTIQKMKET